MASKHANFSKFIWWHVPNWEDYLFFPLLRCLNDSGPEVGQMVAVAEHECEELACTPVPGDIACRFGDGAEEPAQIEPVGPDWDVDLVSTKEGDGCANAVDSGTVRESAFEVESQAFLGTAADGHDDVLRAKAIEAFEQDGIGECPGG